MSVDYSKHLQELSIRNGNTSAVAGARVASGVASNRPKSEFMNYALRRVVDSRCTRPCISRCHSSCRKGFGDAGRYFRVHPTPSLGYPPCTPHSRGKTAVWWSRSTGGAVGGRWCL